MGEHRRWRLAAMVTGYLLLAASWAAGAPAEGDPRKGEALYVGTASFENGGAPCLACHGVAGFGLGKAAGASYGPDLTNTYADFGEMLDDALESMPFPSMEALYIDRPLTQEERADLVAFLQEVSGREPPRIAGSMLVETGAGVGALFVIVGLLGRRRLQALRGTLADHSRSHR